MEKKFELTFAHVFVILFMLTGFAATIATFIWLCFGGSTLSHNLSLILTISSFAFICLTVIAAFIERDKLF